MLKITVEDKTPPFKFKVLQSRKKKTHEIQTNLLKYPKTEELRRGKLVGISDFPRRKKRQNDGTYAAMGQKSVIKSHAFKFPRI